jgi:hypothetical protein
MKNLNPINKIIEVKEVVDITKELEPFMGARPSLQKSINGKDVWFSLNFQAGGIEIPIDKTMTKREQYDEVKKAMEPVYQYYNEMRTMVRNMLRDKAKIWDWETRKFLNLH